MGIPEKDKIYTYEESLTWSEDVPQELIYGKYYDWNGKPVSWQPADVYYTNEDFNKKWRHNNRWELIYGVPYAMASPSTNHQVVVGEMYDQLKNHLKGKKCRVIPSPYDVKLEFPGEKGVRVQPDLIVICDHSRIKRNYYNGPPDLVIEVLSPSTAKKDKSEKFLLYQRAGVKEYWIVDPANKVVDVFVLEEGRYNPPKSYGYEDTVKVQVLDNCQINLEDVFVNIIEDDD